jgi:toxin ParE1/3/4
MTQKLIIRPEAEKDIFSAYDWYEEQRLNLGTEFAQELSNSMDLIIEFPKMYSELYRGIRRALLKRFPYGVYYVVKDDTNIVVAVHRLAMDPEKWKSRT